VTDPETFTSVDGGSTLALQTNRLCVGVMTGAAAGQVERPMDVEDVEGDVIASINLPFFARATVEQRSATECSISVTVGDGKIERWLRQPTGVQYGTSHDGKLLAIAMLNAEFVAQDDMNFPSDPWDLMGNMVDSFADHLAVSRDRLDQFNEERPFPALGLGEPTPGERMIETRESVWSASAPCTAVTLIYGNEFDPAAPAAPNNFVAVTTALQSESPISSDELRWLVHSAPRDGDSVDIEFRDAETTTARLPTTDAAQPWSFEVDGQARTGNLWARGDCAVGVAQAGDLQVAVRARGHDLQGFQLETIHDLAEFARGAATFNERHIEAMRNAQTMHASNEAAVPDDPRAARDAIRSLLRDLRGDSRRFVPFSQRPDDAVPFHKLFVRDVVDAWGGPHAFDSRMRFHDSAHQPLDGRFQKLSRDLEFALVTFRLRKPGGSGAIMLSLYGDEDPESWWKAEPDELREQGGTWTEDGHEGITINALAARDASGQYRFVTDLPRVAEEAVGGARNWLPSV
jgi:hypothetical protein